MTPRHKNSSRGAKCAESFPSRALNYSGAWKQTSDGQHIKVRSVLVHCLSIVVLTWPTLSPMSLKKKQKKITEKTVSCHPSPLWLCQKKWWHALFKASRSFEPCSHPYCSCFTSLPYIRATDSYRYDRKIKYWTATQEINGVPLSHGLENPEMKHPKCKTEQRWAERSVSQSVPACIHKKFGLQLSPWSAGTLKNNSLWIVDALYVNSSGGIIVLSICRFTANALL